MRYICEAPDGCAWFRIETVAEAEAESAAMRHAVEKFFRKAMAEATETYRPISTVLFEQDIGLKAHIQREMPIFLTLRNDDGEPLATAMLPPGGRDDGGFTPIIVGPQNGNPYIDRGEAIAALAKHFGIALSARAAIRIAAEAAADRRSALEEISSWHTHCSSFPPPAAASWRTIPASPGGRGSARSSRTC